MILKFSQIKNMAVFKDFIWNSTVPSFRQVNVIYGRNYSGKTTLSRIIRAFETGVLSDKYDVPSFSIETDKDILTESDFSQRKLLVRVFNEDFVRENLQFIINPDASIAPFAVLGENNKIIEEKILKLTAELGSNEENKETGLYKKKLIAFENCQEAQEVYKKVKDDLDKKKSNKATDKSFGIKYDPNRYGNQNYNIRNLETDIETVLSDSYISLTEDEKRAFEENLHEQRLPEPIKILPVFTKYSDIVSKVKDICERKISVSEKMQNLLNDYALEQWVQQGLALNKERKECAFCGQPITDNRWQELYKHFDKESERLSKDIEDTIKQINLEEKRIKDAFLPDQDSFYAKYKAAIANLEKSYKELTDQYSSALRVLADFLEQRKQRLHLPLVFSVEEQGIDFSSIFAEYNKICDENIEYTNSLTERTKIAQNKLRLDTVEDFVKTINYKDAIEELKALEKKKEDSIKALGEVESKINQNLRSITNLKRQQNDEEKGALKINEYLKTCFGYRYLSLVAKEKLTGAEKSIYFEVERNGKKAYHLSEGERSLIAFCYFIAKLEDVETIGTRPIIWIDDPISSLDCNHIYFMYSLIEQKILINDCYEQLFITTHNLPFLKYLRRLSINRHHRGEERENPRCNYVIERNGDNATILAMPNYLKEHGTEFNYWFNCIYQCAVQEKVTDKNRHYFENFGNNARKFLETYLYYKYPDKDKFDSHLKRLFRDNTVPAILIRKIGDEQSHAAGDLENHGLPFEEPEIVAAAKLIINILKKEDKEQFDALKSTVASNN